MKKKFRLEAASDNEAAFIFCNYNPIMRAKVVVFRSHKDMDDYKTDNKTISVRRQLPIILELTEVDSTNEDLITQNFTRMAEWYYYTHIKPSPEGK